MPNAVERHRRGAEAKYKLQEGRSRKCVIYVCRLKFLFPEARQPCCLLKFCFSVLGLCFSGVFPIWLNSVVFMFFLCFVCFC